MSEFFPELSAPSLWFSIDYKGHDINFFFPPMLQMKMKLDVY